MSFTWPAMLSFLLVIPLFLWLYISMNRRRERITTSYSALLGRTAAGRNQPGFRRHVPAVLFLAGLAILIVSLARPKLEMRLPRVEGTVMLLFDVSGSMAAEDADPTRIEAAKAAARNFVARQPSGVRIGVVAFSDNGFSVQKPSKNQEEIFAAIDRLTIQRGTSLGQGILASMNAIAADRDLEGQAVNLDGLSTPAPGDRFTSASILLISDGENNVAPDPVEAAQAAAEYGIRIYTVGVGTSAGSVLEIEGFRIHTRLYEDTLKQIAQVSRGSYFSIGNEELMDEIYATISPQMVFKAEEMEVTSVFAGASILLLLVGGAFSLAWFGRLP
jgi:Ca-activated chloride channel family protein